MHILYTFHILPLLSETDSHIKDIFPYLYFQEIPHYLTLFINRINPNSIILSELMDSDVDLGEVLPESSEEKKRYSGSGKQKGYKPDRKNSGSFNSIEKRRRNTFYLMMQGKKNTEIADILNVSLATVQQDKIYIESTAYDSLKSQIGSKAVFVTMSSMHIADFVIEKAREIASGERKAKKTIRSVNVETGEPVVQTIDVEPTIADINSSLKIMLDGAKMRADLALNNYVFIAESESLKKLETDILKIDLNTEDMSEVPSGFVVPEELQKGLEDKENAEG